MALEAMGLSQVTLPLIFLGGIISFHLFIIQDQHKKNYFLLGNKCSGN